MLEQTVLYVVVEDDRARRIQAICQTVEEAEKTRAEILDTFQSSEVPGLCATGLSIHAMNAVFPGDRYRLVYGTPKVWPASPLEVPAFQLSRVTNADALSEAYLYPDQLYVYRKEALAAAARHNADQLKRPPVEMLDWAVVVEIGEPLWRKYRSECVVRMGVGWEDTDLVRPVRAIVPTRDEASGFG